MTTGFDDIPEIALDWHRAGKGAVLATVVQTWGSAPRPVGSQLGDLRAPARSQARSRAAASRARWWSRRWTRWTDGKTRMLEFGVSDDEAFAVGLACGGTIRVMVEPVGKALPEAMLAEICDARAARRPIAYVGRHRGAARGD